MDDQRIGFHSCHDFVPRLLDRLRGPLNPLLGVHWGLFPLE
jgi:hypothetical protein